MTFYDHVVLGSSVHETRLWASCHVPHLRAQISSLEVQGSEVPSEAPSAGPSLWPHLVVIYGVFCLDTCTQILCVV